jgi:hypothetical protein
MRGQRRAFLVARLDLAAFFPVRFRGALAGRLAVLVGGASFAVAFFARGLGPWAAPG